MNPSIPAHLAALLPEYELLRELGRGGAAIVYLARDRELGREVALKLIREHFLDDAETAARFAREARTVARLQHPSIVAVYGARRLTDGMLVLVMQHVPGGTLKQLIRQQGPLPFGRVERVLADVAAALEHAHGQGVIHRDIKPENIYLHEVSGRALLADFGIAKPLDAENLTISGTVIGTPAYMSPEQVDGRAVDGRSDLYSLALVGYEMLTGRRPWEGENLYSIIYKQKHEELPALERLRPDTPPSLAAALERALRKEREERWSSVAEFASHLAPAPHAPGTATAPEQGRAASTPVQPVMEDDEGLTIRYRRPSAEKASQAPPVPAAVPKQPEPVLRAGPARRVRRRRRAVGLAVVFVLGAGATLLARSNPEPRPSEVAAAVPAPVVRTEPLRDSTPILAPPPAGPPAAKPEPEVMPEPEVKPEPKPRPEPTAKPEAKAEAKPEVKPKPRPAERSVPKPAAKSPRPAPRTDRTRPAPEAVAPRLAELRVEARLAAADEHAPKLDRVEISRRVRNRGAAEAALAASLPPAERGPARGVSLWVLVGPEGRARAARVNSSSGSAVVDAAAIRAAMRLEFDPAAREPLMWVKVALSIPGS